jgi:serine/threonine-protein kinase
MNKNLEKEIIQLGQVRFELKEEHDFSWLNDMGDVFAVFDQQDSGNICFGVQQNRKKIFVKYAGAKTLNFPGQPKEAVQRLKYATQVYSKFEHEVLAKFIEGFDTVDGYALAFEWFDGENLYDKTFPPPEKYTNLNSPYCRFKKLPVSIRMNALEQTFKFHLMVEEKGYVAIDFYDGCLMYDFSNHTIKICDIDLYSPKPYINTMGRMYGSKRFMSPEEFTLGAKIDEVTNVYNMGATAFCLLGDEKDRTLEKWNAPEELYHLASKAINKDRNKRYTSLKMFYKEWKTFTELENKK